jgi:plastocyanin
VGCSTAPGASPAASGGASSAAAATSAAASASAASASAASASSAAATAAPSATTATAAPGSAAASASPAASASGSPSGSAAGSAAATGQLAITAQEYSFQAPPTVAAGVTTITVTNSGKEEHQAQLARIADGKQLSDVLGALSGPDPSALFKLVTLSGGPTGVPPGGSAAVTVNLEPGNYVMLCFVQGPDGIPHLAKGMVAPLQVTGTASTAALPATDASVTLQDFAFVGLDTLSPGAHSILVSNSGPQPHEVTVVRLAQGVTIDAIRAAFTSATPPAGPVPWTPSGGVAGLVPGKTASIALNLTAGNYAFICFVPDAASGKPHAALGMVQAVTVK